MAFPVRKFVNEKSRDGFGIEMRKELPEVILRMDAELLLCVADNLSRDADEVRIEESLHFISSHAVVRNTAEAYYPGEWYLAGEGVSTYDLMDTVTSDMVKVNLVAIGAVFLVLLLTMKSLVLPVILVLSIETAVWINLAIPYFAGHTVFYIAYLIISSIQLGATVDYAILFTDRYREMRETFDRGEAVIHKNAGRTGCGIAGCRRHDRRAESADSACGGCRADG